MTTIKSFTDIEQSKKLAEILPPDSADMTYDAITEGMRERMIIKDWQAKIGLDIAIKENRFSYRNGYVVPCWSLAALLEQLPYEVCDDNGKSLYLQINKEDDVYQLEYTGTYEGFGIETDRYEHFVDACVSMILKLNELNLL